MAKKRPTTTEIPPCTGGCERHCRHHPSRYLCGQQSGGQQLGGHAVHAFLRIGDVDIEYPITNWVIRPGAGCDVEVSPRGIAAICSDDEGHVIADGITYQEGRFKGACSRCGDAITLEGTPSTSSVILLALRDMVADLGKVEGDPSRWVNVVQDVERALDQEEATLRHARSTFDLARMALSAGMQGRGS